MILNLKLHTVWIKSHELDVCLNTKLSFTLLKNLEYKETIINEHELYTSNGHR